LKIKTRLPRSAREMYLETGIAAKKFIINTSRTITFVHSQQDAGVNESEERPFLYFLLVSKHFTLVISRVAMRLVI